MTQNANDLGITIKKEDNFSEWYLEVVRKGKFKDQRTPIKGLDVFMPWGYALWEKIQENINLSLKKMDVKNMYFPLLIPESLLKKEEEHFKGFTVEAATVTEVGKTKLNEKLIIRPTSETIMYHMFSQWIRSYRDLPLKINQWCNVIRWETKATKPFIRDREFLWQEGHTAHETREDAVEQVNNSVEMYSKLYEMLALSALELQRTPADTFAGADYTVALDTLVDDGKVFQGPGTHLLGQNFSKPFDVKFENKNEKTEYVWQTSWGVSTRQIGGILMQHGDNKGAVLPPQIAPIQVVITPIIFKNKKEPVIKASEKLLKQLEKIGIRTEIDQREEYSSGFKFNEWELKGVPIRIEIGPRDVENSQTIAVRRDTGEKITIKENDSKHIEKILDDIQNALKTKAKNDLYDKIFNTKDKAEFDKIIKSKKGGFIRANWCGNPVCEKKVKEDTNGVEIRGTLYNKKEKVFGTCLYCNKEAKEVVYLAKAY
ncbi:MAG: proline--tRNA ligase [DPANN group archaeon]|nr:proline--tRNA ligase [DPANN group archaeon]